MVFKVGSLLEAAFICSDYNNSKFEFHVRGQYWRSAMKLQCLLTAAVLQTFMCPLEAAEERSEVEAYVASIHSVGEVKSRLYEHLNPECGTGVCMENNAAEVCNLVGALDIRVGGVIASPGQPAQSPSLGINGSDLQLMRRIWNQCKPTSWGHWNRNSLLRVTYQGDAKEVTQLSSMLRGPAKQGSGGVIAGRTTRLAEDVALSSCMMEHAKRGAYSSFDGGQSALSLAKVCYPAVRGWIEACVTRGEPEDSCNGKVLILSQAALKMVGK